MSDNANHVSSGFTPPTQPADPGPAQWGPGLANNLFAIGLMAGLGDSAPHTPAFPDHIDRISPPPVKVSPYDVVMTNVRLQEDKRRLQEENKKLRTELDATIKVAQYRNEAHANNATRVRQFALDEAITAIVEAARGHGMFRIDIPVTTVADLAGLVRIGALKVLDEREAADSMRTAIENTRNAFQMGEGEAEAYLRRQQAVNALSRAIHGAVHNGVGFDAVRYIVEEIAACEHVAAVERAIAAKKAEDAIPWVKKPSAV